MDYSQLIDAETWAFIRKTDEFYPPEAVSFTIEDQRRVYDRMCRAFFNGYPDGVQVTDRPFDGVPCRVYEIGASKGTVVYLHGGGFVVGGLESHDDVCAEICERTGFRVVSVDYRLCPEHLHPDAFGDAMAATKAVADAFAGWVILAGDSAGGNLAAAVAHKTRGAGLPIVGQVLIYPGLGGDMTKGSYLTHANAPMLTLNDIQFYKTIRVGDAPEPRNDAAYAPLQDMDFTGLPQTAIITAQCDPLASDGADYAAALSKAGVPVTLTEEPGLVHGYLRARTTVGRAARSFDRIIGHIRAFGDGGSGA